MVERSLTQQVTIFVGNAGRVPIAVHELEVLTLVSRPRKDPPILTSALSNNSSMYNVNNQVGTMVAGP